MRVRGQAADGEKTENLLVTLDVIVPTELDERQREAVQAMAEAFEEDPRAALFEKQHNRRSSDG
jgi:DnaJ-class molecular chaperone